MKEMEFLGVRVPRNVKEWLERIAEESEVPVSRVVRMILEAEMERSEGVRGGRRKRKSSGAELFALYILMKGFVMDRRKMVTFLSFLKEADPEGFERALREVKVEDVEGR
jgi:hypothetical protein